jgi:hypothetical protein
LQLSEGKRIGNASALLELLLVIVLEMFNFVVSTDFGVLLKKLRQVKGII